jgi:hypothetical protein
MHKLLKDDVRQALALEEFFKDLLGKLDQFWVELNLGEIAEARKALLKVMEECNLDNGVPNVDETA